MAAASQCLYQNIGLDWIDGNQSMMTNRIPYLMQIKFLQLSDVSQIPYLV